MNRLGFSVGIAALLIVSTVAADVVWTNLPGLGDPHTLGRYEIDIDGNGVWEVAFEGDSVQFSAVVNEHVQLQAYPQSPPDRASWASPLLLGDVVGSKPLNNAVWHDTETGTSGMRVCVTSGCAGYWPGGHSLAYYPERNLTVALPTSGYLAVAFTNVTGLHYGWVDVGVLDFAANSWIYGWGWETEAETPVTIVPEPGSVGLLLLFAGLAALRRAKRTPCYSRESLSER
jgi:hypothetical protein